MILIPSCKIGNVTDIIGKIEELTKIPFDIKGIKLCNLFYKYSISSSKINITDFTDNDFSMIKGERSYNITYKNTSSFKIYGRVVIQISKNESVAQEDFDSFMNKLKCN